jgi:cysteine desulfurase/selenocysteine lyase
MRGGRSQMLVTHAHRVNAKQGCDPPVLDISAMTDPLAIRAQFPMLRTTSRGKPIVYLDSGASAQKPQVVLDAMMAYYTGSYANIHRGVYEASERASLAYDGTRDTVARFLGGVSPEEIVFVRGTTEAINLVAQSYLRPTLRPDDWVLVTEMEHHGNIVPWQLVGARTVPIPLTDTGALDLVAAEGLLAEGPRLLAVVHASNALGTINPIAQLAAMARRNGVPVLVDGAQAVAHLTVDVKELGVDFYCFSGHKLYGPTGVGVLWARRELLDAMPPWQGGGDMIDRVAFEGTTFAPVPHKFEAGTPDIAGVIGLDAAIKWLGDLDREAVERREHQLWAEGHARLSALDGVKMVSAATDNVGILTFTLEGAHPHDVASLLDQDGICVRAGHHCTQPLHRRLGLPATVRASIAAYTTAEEIEALATSLGRIREMFR